ncbi:MAG: IS21 family transposase, partial [Phyllobacteriaceae bacterium]|nr:IS21 family transposase [Phyllobacteriaceae bacterium]
MPELVVCDNLKAGVTKASRVEPTINATYREMAEHYGGAVLPTRPRKPRDKAKVEVGVQIVERWILARLRHRNFFGLDELASEIERLTGDLNARVMRHLGVSRRELFEKTDRPTLRPLPQARDECAEWRRARVGIDYHVEVDARFYSVPYRLLKEEVDVRVTARTIEVFHQHRRVASHARVGAPHAHVTVADHMPSHHRQFRDWTHERVLKEAASIGDKPARSGQNHRRTKLMTGRKTGSTSLGLRPLAPATDVERREPAVRHGVPLSGRACKARSRQPLRPIAYAGLVAVALPGSIINPV